MTLEEYLDTIEALDDLAGEYRAARCRVKPYQQQAVQITLWEDTPSSRMRVYRTYTFQALLDMTQEDFRRSIYGLVYELSSKIHMTRAGKLVRNG